MIKHYDRFIGGHDSTVNHRRKRAMRARGYERDPLTTRCHSRTTAEPSQRRGRPPSRWKSFCFFRSCRASLRICSRTSMRAASSHAFRWSIDRPVIAGWIEASATRQRGNPWRNYVRGRVIGPVVAIVHASHVSDYYTPANSDESNYLARRIISMALLILRTSSTCSIYRV